MTRKPVRQVEREAQHPLGNDDGETALLAQHVERFGASSLIIDAGYLRPVSVQDRG
jgi:hypothetical protein